MMNTLRSFSNAIRANNNTINFVQNQLKHDRIWCGKRVIHNYSTTVLIRNTTTTSGHHRWAGFAGSSSGSSSRECSQQLGLLLPQQLQGVVSFPSIFQYGQKRGFSTKTSPDRANKSDTKAAAAAEVHDDLFAHTSKLGLFAKFKLMYKMYWYVLIPVHVVTSVGWLGGFYYLSQSGVDVPAVLQYLHLSETIIEKVQGSSLGHWAVAYLCYKVATPLRYAVTLGGTTVSIKYLVQQGHIKPMPTKAEFMQMYEDKKAQRAADKMSKDNASSKPHDPPHEQK